MSDHEKEIQRLSEENDVLRGVLDKTRGTIYEACNSSHGIPGLVLNENEAFYDQVKDYVLELKRHLYASRGNVADLRAQVNELSVDAEKRSAEDTINEDRGDEMILRIRRVEKSIADMKAQLGPFLRLGRLGLRFLRACGRGGEVGSTD